MEDGDVGEEGRGEGRRFGLFAEWDLRGGEGGKERKGMGLEKEGEIIRKKKKKKKPVECLLERQCPSRRGHWR